MFNGANLIRNSDVDHKHMTPRGKQNSFVFNMESY